MALKKPKIKYLIVLAVLLLLAIACLIAHNAFASALLTQKQAERFRGESEMDFAQFSFFTTAYEGKSIEDVYKYHQMVSEKLAADSLSAPEGGRLISDCWSAQDTLKLEGPHGKADATVLAVGGDFFEFHPMTLVSGGLLQERDIMKDRIVIDEVLAWMLYGGSDLAGMELTVGEQTFVIAGVVERDSDRATEKAWGDSPICFIPYEMYMAMFEQGQKITGYEIVLPEPVDGFAEGVLTEVIGDSGDLVKNSGRFSLGNSLGALKNFGMSAMRQSGVVYPFWENAARYTESWCSLFAALFVLFLILPGGTVLVYAVWGVVLGRRKLRTLTPQLKEKAVEKVEQRRMVGYSRGGSHVKKKGS